MNRVEAERLYHKLTDKGLIVEFTFTPQGQVETVEINNKPKSWKLILWKSDPFTETALDFLHKSTP